ncbi:cell death abnormality protein 12 [Aphelenchoides avenae]|nr:cell death abnormality protein 12 [Aphelenchus avenae]
MTSSFHAPAKNLNFIDTRPKDNEVKGAVQLDRSIADFMVEGFSATNVPEGPARNTLAIFDKQNDNLTDFITRLSKQLELPQDVPGGYGLMFDEDRQFVTDENRQAVKQGFLLVLTASPENYARTLMRNLETTDPSRYQQTQKSLAGLVSLSSDTAFARELHRQDGIRMIVNTIEEGLFDANVTCLFQVLQAFLLLMGHSGLLEWNELTPKFAERISAYINGSSKIENNDSLYLALSIVQNMFSRCKHLEDVIMKEIRFESLIRHLEKSDERILLGTLSLMNLIYVRANDEERLRILRIIHDKPFRTAIESVIQREARSPDQRMREQLIQIQEILFKEIKNLVIRTSRDEEIQHVFNMRQWKPHLVPDRPELNGSFERISLSDSMVNGEDSASIEHFRRLVKSVPPGSLALDAILDYASRFATRLMEIQTESSLPLNVWPVVMVHLVTALIQILAIPVDNVENQTTSTKFLRLLFKAERPFHDLFAATLELFHRTWREMHANVDDLDKVITVVRDQMERALGTNPFTFGELNKTLQQEFSYFHMQKLWERERIEREELELQSNTVRELRDHLRPSIESLVRRRKINFLKEGMVFGKVVVGKSQGMNKGDRHWHWKLDDSERQLSYVDGNGPTSVEPRKTISVLSIRRVVHGVEYNDRLSQQAGAKPKKSASTATMHRCGFSIEVSDQMESYNLCADDESKVHAWIDGLNCLINPEKSLDTQLLKAEVERLLNLEVRVRLLEVENPPADNLPFPELPTDFSWIPEPYRAKVH